MDELPTLFRAWIACEATAEHLRLIRELEHEPYRKWRGLNAGIAPPNRYSGLGRPFRLRSANRSCV